MLFSNEGHPSPFMLNYMQSTSLLNVVNSADRRGDIKCLYRSHKNIKLSYQ